MRAFAGQTRMTNIPGEDIMDLGATDKVRPLVSAVRATVRDQIMPIEEEYHAEIGREGDRFKPTARMTEIMETLKQKARSQGLWNFWLTGSDKGYGLTTVEYAYLAEEMGWSMLASEVFNCSAPDTGNMEVIERYGSPEHKARWLPDLLAGRARSAHLMNEPRGGQGHREAACYEGLRLRRRAARPSAYPLHRCPRPRGCADSRPRPRLRD